MASPILVQASLSYGWNTFKKRPWLFLGTVLIYAAVQFVLAMIESYAPFVSLIANLVIGTLLAIGFMTLYLKAHDDLAGADIKDMWNPKPFWQYLVASIVIAIIVILGLIALIVPGIILGIAFSMAPYLVVEKRIWVMQALKESWAMTKGNWLSLFLLGVVLAVINIVGALLLMIGLLVTIPVSMLAMVHVYRTLSGVKTLPEAEVKEEVEVVPVA